MIDKDRSVAKRRRNMKKSEDARSEIQIECKFKQNVNSKNQIQIEFDLLNGVQVYY